jgi:hypothetical protein
LKQHKQPKRAKQPLAWGLAAQSASLAELAQALLSRA